MSTSCRTLVHGAWLLDTRRPAFEAGLLYEPDIRLRTDGRLPPGWYDHGHGKMQSRAGLDVRRWKKKNLQSAEEGT